MLGKFDRQQIQSPIFVRLIEAAEFAGKHTLKTQRRPAAPVVGPILGLGIDSSHPVEPVDRHDEAMVVRLPQDFANTNPGVLHMSGHNLDVIFVEGDEF